ncbi:sulfotransferase [Vibrio sp.]|nr:sulfotransferase [Vibrio sp.]
MTKLTKYLNFFSHPIVTLAPKTNIFIMSHMRATSSVLTHVLSSHTQICGHSELHSSYINYVHQLKTRAALYDDKESFTHADFLLDKLLHNKLKINESSFPLKPKYIFLLRDPERTMISMIKMHLNDKNSKDTIYKLEDYYLNRLDALTEYWQHLQGEKIYVSSESLTQQTDEVLKHLTEFLSLSSPLKSEYKVYRDTGVSGRGDPSANIKSGKILASTPVDLEGKALLGDLNMNNITSKYTDAVNLMCS